jgi:lipopolysaccharide/colanic/teichoic acid biosynthesis glycosyltransferase
MKGATMAAGDQERKVLPMTDLLIRQVPWWKRVMDVMGALAALIFFGPFMLLTALAVKLTSGGPVIFRQLRAGLGGRPFVMYKFRSMCDRAEEKRDELRAAGELTRPAFKMKDDPRVTPVGRFIRRWSIDEMPQFWNVLTGEMSLVGPRPLPVEDTSGFAQWQRWRLTCVPGLTCFWQISGRSDIGFDDWVRMDIRYQRECSPLTDLKILVRTPGAVLSRKGAY